MSKSESGLPICIHEMEKIAESVATASSRHARNILRAWDLRDAAWLTRAFQEALTLPLDDSGVDGEHVELLQSVVQRLRDSAGRPDREPDSNVRICVSLLTHLAFQDLSSHPRPARLHDTFQSGTRRTCQC